MAPANERQATSFDPDGIRKNVVAALCRLQNLRIFLVRRAAEGVASGPGGEGSGQP